MVTSAKLPRNPLHQTAPQVVRNDEQEEDADEDDVEPMIQQATPNTPVSFMVMPRMASSRVHKRAAALTSPSHPAVRIRTFFDTLVNAPFRNTAEAAAAASKTEKVRPRLIYVRDFPTLAATSSTWYAPLLNAVRDRRRWGFIKSQLPVQAPITIVFGISPPLTPSSVSVPTPGPSNFAALLSRTNARPSSSREKTPSFGEDEQAEKAREKRLRRRLQLWERNDAAFHHDIPKLSANIDGDEVPQQKVEVVMLGPEQTFGQNPGISSILSGLMSNGGMGGAPGVPPLARMTGQDTVPFYRTSTVVPSVRSTVDERKCRIARRQEINELTMRMGVGASHGVLDKLPQPKIVADASVAPETAPAEAITEQPAEGESSTTEPAESEAPAEVVEAAPEAVVDVASPEPTQAPHPQQDAQPAPPPAFPQEAFDKMRAEWGNKLELWSEVRHVADRAVGSVLAATPGVPRRRSTLEPTPVPWSAVVNAWQAARNTQTLRKAWAKACSNTKAAREQDEEDDEAEDAEENGDEIIERVKSDPDLDPHEQRLLPTIVSSASMPTSFDQVHLPTHTIDSVRTIVSLPLLHPSAFQSGILKEHGMTGCLLFGPPGTGKTLVVRALAKEAGVRMMTISPSDVMDMYVGEGEKLVRAVFSLARRLAPCVVFLDEIDALFGARMSARESGGAFAHRGVITEFMQEMDGLTSSNEDSVIVIGATNRPFDLDDAVLRRLPRRLLVDLPGEKEREEILKILLRDETLGEDVDVKALAKRTESFSGSDLKHLCVSAALDAVKELVTVPWASTTKPAAPSVAEVEVASPSEPVTSAESAPAAAAEAQAENTWQGVEATQEPLATPDVAPAPEATESAASETAAPTAEGKADAPAEGKKSDAPTPETKPTTPPRVLNLRHFEKAMKEITPSSSEALGSLAELRKWNDEFGEGRKDKRRKQVWGKGSFGFTNVVRDGEAGRVATPEVTPASQSQPEARRR
ncbi:AAA-domain-containing protein [Schizophyllum commune Tattone D]|nr:AAA-domain-containing protein [Schizophyllum commune Tattone D]